MSNQVFAVGSATFGGLGIMLGTWGGGEGRDVFVQVSTATSGLVFVNHSA